MTSLEQKTTGLFTAAALSLAALTPQFATQAHADEADVTIRYGSNIEESEMKGWAESLGRGGVTAEIIKNLESPNCAAVVYNGEEKYRFSQKRIDRGTLAMVAEKLAKGERISKRTKSDCPVDVATLDSPT
jgi:hypothetical protein